MDGNLKSSFLMEGEVVSEPPIVLDLSALQQP